MQHTYVLSCDGFISPEYMRDRSPRVMGVEHPRTLQLEGMTLRLHEGQPDLPVGIQVEVWCDSFFHCETLEYIEAKAAAKADRAAARQEHEESVKHGATTNYLEPTRALIAGKPSVANLREHLDMLYEEQDAQRATYHQYWHARDPENKQRSNDALAISGVISDSIRTLSDYVFAQLETSGVKGISSHANTRHEGGNTGFFSPGKDHFKLLAPVESGKFKRDTGDALCKPAIKFHCLQRNDAHHAVTCCACLDRMLRLLN